MREVSIMCPEDRERFKAEADYKTIGGALDVIYADYEGSREAWYSVKRWKKDHPSYEEYVRAYVANPYCEKLFGEKLAWQLYKRFPGIPSRHLPDGSTIWLRKPAKYQPPPKLPYKKMTWPPSMVGK